MSVNQQAEVFYMLMLGAAVPGVYLSGELPSAAIGQPYSAGLACHGAHGDVYWQLIGDLPNGLSIDSATGVISGICLEEFAISFADYQFDPDESVSTALLTVGRIGSVSWDVIDGVLPPGLTLSPSGVLSGVVL